MSHDLEAAWASSELARKIITEPNLCFSSASPRINAFAGRDGNKNWPFADGVIDIELLGGGDRHLIAVEYKRPNEGTHGVLTAIGQSHAYLKKGYSASVMILPETYPSLNDVGAYVSEVLNTTSQRPNIGICTYTPPDTSSPTPFKNKLNIHKNFLVDVSAPVSGSAPISKIETQWAHVREGSTEPDAFFRYLSALKLVGGIDAAEAEFKPPRELENAVKTINPSSDALHYLSYCSGNSVHDRAWRYFWYTNILYPQMMIGWQREPSGEFEENHKESKVLKFDNSGKKQFFSGRSDSIKTKCVKLLNAGKITEDEAWQKLAKNFHDRAHSYREDIDSGLEKIGFIETSGRMTESGYKFLEASEKSQNANSPIPFSLMAKSLLVEGGFNSFLHYVHKLSDEKFKDNPLAFTSEISGKLKFDSTSYLNWLENQLADNLNVLKKVSIRGGTKRKPLQAELAILRAFKIILPSWRIGVGVPINWPEVQKLQENI
ncbi:hypothetical protein N9315_03035 [Alphaproteobacteria bacterium]|nr:hypothetical protein [Alphaproteobacteria bacterium]